MLGFLFNLCNLTHFLKLTIVVEYDYDYDYYSA